MQNSYVIYAEDFLICRKILMNVNDLLLRTIIWRFCLSTEDLISY